MDLDKIKLGLVKMIKNKKGVSFVEIEDYFDEVGFDYHGEHQFVNSDNKNIVFWSDWNEIATKLLIDLLREKIIKMTPTDVLVYLADGKLLTLPVYKDDKPYEQWLPVVFN
jgi:hypothetical protein